MTVVANGEAAPNPVSLETPAKAETPTSIKEVPPTPPMAPSDTSILTKASKKSIGSGSTGSDRNGYPSQISYNANPTPINGQAQQNMRMTPPPNLMGSPVSQMNGSFDHMAAGGYSPHAMHAYQVSSSPVVLTNQSPSASGIAYPTTNAGNYPPHIMSPGLPPTPPTTLPYAQRQELNNSSGHNSSRNANSIGSNSSGGGIPPRRTTHRKSNSYGGVSYGAVEASFFSPPLPPGAGAPPLPRPPNTKPTHARRRSTSEDFSPVDEVRKLTGSGGGARAPISPTPRASVNRHYRAKSEDWQGRMPGVGRSQPPIFPASSNLQQQSSPANMINRGVYMGDGADDLLAFNGSIRSIHSNRERSGSFRSDDGSEGGGEAVFLVNKNNNRQTQSSRGRARTKKRHMRQRSAQIFMEDVKGVEQLPSCRDLGFFMLFVFHLLGIVYLGRTYGNEALRIHDESEEDSSASVTFIFQNLIYLAGLSGVFAMVISGLTLLLMTTIANKIVQIALILSISFSFVWGTMGIGLSPRKIVPIAGIVALAFSVAYAFIVWDRIPFAAANLNAGFSGILANPGAILLSFVFQVLALGWSVYYIFVGAGVYDAIVIGEFGESFDNAGYVVYTLLGVSYYWTLHVFLNIVQVTVASVMGRWWYTPDGDDSNRGADLNHAFFRSFFYSIGSICFGSLLVGPVRILRQLSVFFRPADEVHSLMTLHECVHCIQSSLTNCVEALALRFSPWSFTYVGLYGYSLMDAGIHSAELFEKRGWTTIVSDDLVPNVLLLITLTISGVTGIFAHFLERFETLSLTTSQDLMVTPFIIGTLVGLVVSSVLFGIISSSVNAVIILFAASPVDFEQNHPKLSEEMRSAWREVWPGCMDILDMRAEVAGFLDPALNGSLRGQPPMVGGYPSYRSQSERHPLLRR